MMEGSSDLTTDFQFSYTSAVTEITGSLHCNSSLEEITPGMHPGTLFTVILSASVLLINSIVMASLVRIWAKLRQSIYIFALNILICDCLLGIVYICNSVNHFVVRHTSVNGVGATGWFFKIQSATFMSTEVASAGNTALVSLAFSRYVSAQLSGMQKPSRSGTLSKMFKQRKSVLLSRRESYIFSLMVWIISAVILIVGLLWNCTDQCIPFSGESLECIEESRKCHYNNNCSFLFKSQKNIYALVCVTIFLLALVVAIVMCAQTICTFGGIGVVLPYRVHLKMIRKKNRKKEQKRNENTSSLHRRTSIQLSYTRNMTHFILAVTCCYVICRLPGNILLLLDAIIGPRISVSTSLVNTLKLLLFLHSLLNPIILYLKLHRTKQAVNEFLTSCCPQTVVVKGGEKSKLKKHEEEEQEEDGGERNKVRIKVEEEPI